MEGCEWVEVKSPWVEQCLKGFVSSGTTSKKGRLRDDKEFTDVTLVCEGGQLVEAHKVILAASSPVFEKILQDIKHPYPLHWFTSGGFSYKT